MKATVVFLSNTANDKIYRMTSDAINSLVKSDNVDYDIRLVETNVKARVDFPGGTHVIKPGEEFNYNRFLNLGFYHADFPGEYVIISNNDVIFHKGWFERITKAIEEHDLDSASAVSLGWQFHNNLPDDIEEGWAIGRNFCGWNLVFRTESLMKLLPLDEQFEFFCQDNDMAMNMQKLGMRHALVNRSFVTHLANKSHGLVKDMNHFTNEMIDLFHKKWG